VIRSSGLRPARIAGLGLVVTLAAWAAAAAPGSAASPAPTLTVTPAAASVGSTVMVQGQGFPPQVYNLQVAVCGNQGLNGSADCDQAAARTTFSGDGSFALNLPDPASQPLVERAPVETHRLCIDWSYRRKDIRSVHRGDLLVARALVAQHWLYGLTHRT